MASGEKNAKQKYPSPEMEGDRQTLLPQICIHNYVETCQEKKRLQQIVEETRFKLLSDRNAW